LDKQVLVLVLDKQVLNPSLAPCDGARNFHLRGCDPGGLGTEVRQWGPGAKP